MYARKRFLPFLVAVLSVSGALEVRGQPTSTPILERPTQTPELLVKPTDREGSVPIERSPWVVRQRKVIVDWAKLQGPGNERLRLPLFDREIVLVRQEQLVPKSRTFLWFGEVQGQPGSMVILSNVNKPFSGGQALAGDVMTTGPRGESDLYQIRYLGRGVHVLKQIDQSRFPPEASPNSVGVPQPAATQARDVCRDPPTHIDVLVVYTDAARRAAGGKNGIESLIESAVHSTNRSYKKSEVDQKLRLVHTKRVDYDESGVSKRDRDRLENPSDGHLDEVPPLRDVHAADVVALIVNTLDDCGRSNVMAGVSHHFESRAYAVVENDCAVTNFSFAHELGHLMGARHDRQDDPTEGEPFVFNHGFVQKSPTSGGAWRTIMAKEPDANCGDEGADKCARRVARWSNPNVVFPDAASGSPTGTENTDNHRTLNQTAPTVSRFRCANPN